MADPALSVAVPSTVAPFLKVTVPVGIPEVEEVTLAVNVTDWLYEDGLMELVSVALLAALFTVWTRVGEVLPE